MNKDIVWLVSFALTILAMTYGLSVMAPRFKAPTEVQPETPSVAKTT